MDTKPHRKNTLSKDERLCSQKIITGLFEPGFFIGKYPLRINYALIGPELPGASVQVLFSVSKRRFRRAHDRNRVKRILREVYRQNKHELTDVINHAGKKLALAVIYTGHVLPVYADIEKSMKVMLDQLNRKISAD